MKKLYSCAAPGASQENKEAKDMRFFQADGKQKKREEKCKRIAQIRVIGIA